MVEEKKEYLNEDFMPKEEDAKSVTDDVEAASKTEEKKEKDTNDK